MRTRHLLGWFLALSMAVAVIPASARRSAREGAGRAESRPAAQRSAPKQGTSEAPAVRAGTKINAELESSLDAKTAKPGDRVEARVTKDVKQNGHVVVHKGDHLIGQVVQAQSSTHGKAGSQLGVAFDRLATAQGETQLNTVLTSVVSSPSEQRQRMSRESGPPPMLAPMGAPSGGGGGGGGLLGGGVGSSVGGAAGGALGGVGSTVGNVGGAVGGATQTSLGSSSNLGLSTPLRQIHVNSSAQAQNQTGLNSVLSTRQGDLKLESGTTMQFRVAAGASGKKQ
jgi:hypothetical protein